MKPLLKLFPTLNSPKNISCALNFDKKAEIESSPAIKRSSTKGSQKPQKLNSVATAPPKKLEQFDYKVSKE